MSKERKIHIVKSILNNLIKVPAIIVMLIIVITLIDKLGLPVYNSIFYGFDYLPPLWLTVVAVPVFALRTILGYRKSASVFIIILLMHIVISGEINFKGLVNSQPQRSTNAKNISVAAVNVQYYANGFRNVIEGIRKINADVVLLTENVLTDKQAAIFDSIAYPYNVITGRTESSAILSKYPIQTFKEIEFPSYQASLSGGNEIDTLHRNPHRAFLHAVVDVYGTPVNIISIRLLGGRPKDNSLYESLLWSKYLIDTHQKEIDFFIDYIKIINGYLIFGGDFNAHSSSKTIKKLSEVSIDSYLVSNSLLGNTFRPPFPSLRIDYLFSSNGITPVRYGKFNLILSDHYPIYAEFIINKNGSN